MAKTWCTLYSKRPIVGGDVRRSTSHVTCITYNINPFKSTMQSLKLCFSKKQSFNCCLYSFIPRNPTCVACLICFPWHLAGQYSCDNTPCIISNVRSCFSVWHVPHGLRWYLLSTMTLTWLLSKLPILQGKLGNCFAGSYLHPSITKYIKCGTAKGCIHLHQ